MKDFSDYHIYNMQLTLGNDGVKLSSVKDDDAEYTVRFYVQKETGYYYQYAHFYEMYILTYKNGLPTNIHINNWILPPAISIKFANMSHLAQKRVPETFDYYLDDDTNVIFNGKSFNINWSFSDYGSPTQRLQNANLANTIFNELYLKSLIDSEDLYNDIYCDFATNAYIYNRNKLIDILHNLKSNESKYVGTKLEQVISDKIKETLEKLFKVTKE